MCIKANTIYTQLFSHVQLFVIPWTVDHQASLSMGFSKQEYWSGLPFWHQLLRSFIFRLTGKEMAGLKSMSLIWGLVKLLWISGGWVGLQKCWWSRLPSVSFGTWSSMVKYGSGFNMGSSRTMGPSLLKVFWHSSSAMPWSFGFLGVVVGPLVLGIIWGQRFSPLHSPWLPGLHLVLLSLKKCQRLVRNRIS